MPQRARISPRLIVLATGVIIFHTIVTILEEHLFSLDEFKQSAGGAFMTFYLYTATTFLYLPIVRAGARKQERSASATTVLKVALVYVGTTTLTKTSLRYIDVPTQTVLKSAKLLPVMAGSICILGKSFSHREWIAALMLCTGITMFNLSTRFPQLEQTLAGAACIVVALLCDALLGPYQKHALSQGATTSMLMLAQSACGGLLMLVTCLLDGTFWPGLYLLVTDFDVSLTLVLWALALTSGTALVLRLVDEHSAVTAILVTTVRKALTLFASFILFPKHIGIGHPIGACLVFGSAFVTLKQPSRKPRASEREPLLPVTRGEATQHLRQV